LIKEFYLPREIRFTKSQVCWILNNYSDFKLGIWPAQTYVSGYTDPGMRSTKVSGNAKFTVAADVYSEVDVRIKACGVDGGMTEDYFWVGRDYQTIALQHGLATMEVINRIGRCLRYCSGWKRKRRGYKEFYSHKEQGYYKVGV
jgi:hypothetical protein